MGVMLRYAPVSQWSARVRSLYGGKHMLRQRQVLARIVGVCVALVLAAAPLFAQGITGTVTGTVKDASGGVVPGATVTLISESKGTVSTPVVTNATGDFVFPNLAADKYTVQVEMPSFRTLKRTGVEVNPGSRLSLGTLTIEVGGLTDVTTVKSEAPLVQAATGERSFTVSTETVAALPLAGRTYDALLGLGPGVQTQNGLTPVTRLGGGGDSNFMLDGATVMDPGVNRPASRVSVEAIAEVKVVTSGYQAEYGRSSGLQINAVTKSGTNNFRGSLYDVERRSAWAENSKVNKLNGDPKPEQNERDWGFALGGPVGKPGGKNKLFFYGNFEMNPRDFGGTVNRFRVPTLLERQGDFSQSRDNLGNLYPYIKDPLVSGTCSAANQTACFKDGGVLGRIPANRLYSAGINVLKWWPAPNIDQPAGQAYNYESTDPAIRLIGYQPIIRLDYQHSSSLRGSFKFLEYQQPSEVIVGTIPGFNDSKEDNYGIWAPSATINWTINNSTFFEGSWGANYHHQEGCSVTGGEPNFCRNALSVTPAGNRITAGFGAIPYLFPDATILDPGTFSYDVVSRSGSTMWDVNRVQVAPSFAWGSRVANAPPNNLGPFGNFILDTNVWTVNGSITKIWSNHTIKTGYYHFRSLQRRGQGAISGNISFANDSNNPLDTSFGFANAALGVFSSYAQQSRWGEGAYLATNMEGYIQDNWKVKSNLTLDYGVRIVHQVPSYDSYLKSSNFLQDQWKKSAAPVLYVAGCANGVYPCSGSNRQAMNPLTGQFLGATSALAIGTLVPGTGNTTNGVFADGEGIVKTNFKYPAIRLAPRFGAAWDVHGDQTFIVRGSAGLYYDRPQFQNIYNTVNNPPFTRNITVRYGQLQNIGSAGLTTEAAPSLTVWQYDEPLPTSFQWSTGVQIKIPFKTVLDVAYSGQHSYNFPQQANLNSIDLGTAFLESNKDRTSSSTVPGGASIAALNPDIARYFQGYAAINMQRPILWRTYHSIQWSLNRRLSNGLAFSFNDTIGLSDKQQSTLRLQHNSDGSISIRDDQSKADELLGNNNPLAHLMKANFTYQFPKLDWHGGGKGVVAQIVNDWSLSGIWSGATGSAYAVTAQYNSAGNPVNLTGSPDFTPRMRIVGDIGSGCSSDLLRQFAAGGFAGPQVGSDGLESGNGYLKGCFIHQTDLALARQIRLPRKVTAEIRLDIFNAFNQAQVTNRNTTATYASPSAATVATNLPFDPTTGATVASRSLPRGAGFGVATGFQQPRSMQMQLRISF
ncbi:MAG: carboxypeptidase regulatory-like domain-containing protein [Acidobacteria bacterium]|nr:MAG: carboxypeptidase regulatory-like domain-containing protein [Acidobacteriota bacterium]